MLTCLHKLRIRSSRRRGFRGNIERTRRAACLPRRSMSRRSLVTDGIRPWALDTTDAGGQLDEKQPCRRFIGEPRTRQPAGNSVFGGHQHRLPTPVSDYFSSTTTSSGEDRRGQRRFRPQFGFEPDQRIGRIVDHRPADDGSFLNNQFASLFSGNTKSGTTSTAGTWSSASSQTISNNIAPRLRIKTTSVSANRG